MKDTVLLKLHATEADLLGQGGESWVYALDAHRILRIYKNIDLTKKIAKMRSFYKSLNWRLLGLDEQRILNFGIIEGSMYSVERRITGQDLAKVLQMLPAKARHHALDDFFRNAQLLHLLDTRTHAYFSEAIHIGHKRTKDWPVFLCNVAERQLGNVFAAPRQKLLEAFGKRCAALQYSGQPRLVHFDYFPGNVMADGDKVTGVIDFSLSIYGDPLLDVAGAVGYYSLTDGARAADAAYLLRKLFATYDSHDVHRLTTYMLFMAMYWSGCDDLQVAVWSNRILRTWLRNRCGDNAAPLWRAATVPVSAGPRYIADNRKAQYAQEGDNHERQ